MESISLGRNEIKIDKPKDQQPKLNGVWIRCNEYSRNNAFRILHFMDTTMKIVHYDESTENDRMETFEYRLENNDCIIAKRNSGTEEEVPFSKEDYILTIRQDKDKSIRYKKLETVSDIE